MFESTGLGTDMYISPALMWSNIICAENICIFKSDGKVRIVPVALLPALELVTLPPESYVRL